MKRILFIGLGRMGRPMVRHIADKYPTIAHDISPNMVDAAVQETNATGLYDLAGIEDVGTVILMLPTSQHVEQILVEDGLLDQLPSGALVIDMGSSIPASTQRIATLAAKQRIDYVDAPVSGGITKAESADLTILVGGETAAVERAYPYLQELGSNVVIVGATGAGHAAKAINNLVSATNIAVASEAVVRAQAAGIAPDRMIEVLNASTGMSQASQVKFVNHILPGTFAANFAYDLMLKDMSIAMAIESPEEASKVTRTSFEVLRTGREHLGESPDHTEIARVYEHLARQSIEEQE